MRKADKLFQLTNLIRVKQPITASQIATELEVSVRTVYRYIDDLSVSGIPIYGTAGVGYQLHENYELPPLNLTDKEVDVLMLGIKMVSTWTGDVLSDSAQSLANKIEAVLPKHIRDEYSSKVYAPDLLIRRNERDIWEMCYKAIKGEHCLSISYQTPNENKTKRKIRPLGLFYWGGKWTVGSWCFLRKDFRDFRLDRIETIKICENTCIENQSINLQSYLAAIEKPSCS